MAVLNVKASTLMETLMASLLLGLLFSSVAFLLHHYYHVAIRQEEIKQRNQAHATAYFTHFKNDTALAAMALKSENVSVKKKGAVLYIRFSKNPTKEYVYVLE